MKFEIKPGVSFRYSLAMAAELIDAEDVRANDWTKKMMKPELVTVVYHGPGKDGGPIGWSSVNVEGRRRRASDNELTVKETLYNPTGHEFMAPVLAAMGAQAAAIINERLS